MISRNRVFTGGPIREVTIEQVRLPDGRELSDYYQVRMADFALVFATTVEGEVLVLHQYRHGPRRMSLTFPGGALSEGESPLDAARRELLEETGFVSNHWSTYGRYVTNANQYCNTAHLFRAERCHRVSAPTAPDIEQPELLVRPVSMLLESDVVEQFASISHLALLMLATNPQSRATPTA